MLQNFVTLAQEGAASAGNGQQGGGSMLSLFVPLIVVMAVMFFISSRSQKKQRAKQQQMFDAITKGSRIRTVGGFLGTVVEVKNDSFMIELNEKMPAVEIAKNAVATVISPETENTPAK